MGCREIPVGCSVLSADTGFGVCSTLPVQKSVLLHFVFVLTSLLRLVEGRECWGQVLGPPRAHPISVSILLDPH